MGPRKERKIPTELLARFRRAVEDLGHLAIPDSFVDQDTRAFLEPDGMKPLEWHDPGTITRELARAFYWAGVKK